MAVSRAEKVTEQGALEAVFRAVDTAVLVDYRGVTVPQVTELRRQIRAAGASYRVVKNTLAKRAISGTALEAASPISRARPQWSRPEAIRWPWRRP